MDLTSAIQVQIHPEDTTIRFETFQRWVCWLEREREREVGAFFVDDKE